MEARQLFTRETKAISTARRSLLVIESIPGIRYNEIVEVQLGTGETRVGQVIEVGKITTVVQVFGGVSEVDLLNSRVEYKGQTQRLPVSPDILGRIFDGSGNPIDGGPLSWRTPTTTSTAFRPTRRPGCRRRNSSKRESPSWTA